MNELLGEALGTMVLVLLGDGVVANAVLGKSKAENAGWMVITAGWAFGVLAGVNVAILFGGVHAHINPAVSVAMAAAGAFPWEKVPGYAAAQCAGAFLGAVFVWLAFHQHWSHTPDKDAKLSVFATIPAIRHRGWNCVTEVIGTTVLVVGIVAFGAAGAPAQGMGPFLAACLVWGIGLSLGGPTGYAINPARDLGPRIAHALLPIPGKGPSDWGYAWVPVAAPLAGGIASGLLLRILR